ncbi:MAG: hypothetical protein KJP00_10655, partial [Bacteroidia bacterium]|nr:hypothetical protein [Bacteroidia bacterium]
VYAGLTVVGALSLAVYESEVIVDIPMTAFNPYNGLPIYSGTVQREKNIQKIVVLNMETGKKWETDNAELMDLLQTDLLQIDDLEEIINRISDYNQINKINIKNTED